jgi:hypothetical protein
LGALRVKMGMRSPKLASDLRSASRGNGCNGAVVQIQISPRQLFGARPAPTALAGMSLLATG